ncbi:hypothetical protein vseg_001885 [Gypsophila vaccaria]
MSSLLNFFGCFSKPPTTNKYICDGDVCTLRAVKSSRKRERLRVLLSFSRLSARKA